MRGPSRIRKLASETAIYGISSIFGRLINFLLFPFYSNVFTPDEYSPVVVIYAAFVFLNIIYQYGMESAYLKFASDAETSEAKTGAFSTAWISLIFTTTLFTGALLLFRAPFGSVIGLEPEHIHLLYYGAAVLFIDTLCIIPYAQLRLDNRPWRFAIARTAGIMANIGLVLWLILGAGAGIEAVFIANIAASLVSLGFLLPEIARRLRPVFDRALWKELLLFGLPFLPGGLGYAVSNSMNVFFLEQLPPERVVALYGSDPSIATLSGTLGSPEAAVLTEHIVGAYGGIIKLAVIMALSVQMFRYAWQPFFLQHARDSDAPALFARVFTIMTGGLLLLALFVTFLADDIVGIPLPGGRNLVAPTYWVGLQIIPVAVLGFIFQGWYYAFSAGIYIEKKTKVFVTCTLAGSAVAVVANLFLVPVYGMIAAAWATASSFGVMAASLLYYAQRYYPVRYEWGRVGLMSLAATGLYFAWDTMGIFRSLGPELVLLVVAGAAFSAIVMVGRTGIPPQTTDTESSSRSAAESSLDS